MTLAADDAPVPIGPAPQPDMRCGVLLVDDEPAVRRTLGRMLRNRGYEVVTAGSGAEALRLVGRHVFDVVVSDITMPDMDGIELLRHVRQEHPLLPIVLITGAPALASAMQAVEHGAFRYLEKPVPNDALAAVIDKAASYHRIARVAARAFDLVEHAPSSAHHDLEQRFERAMSTLWVAFHPIVDPRKRVVFGHEALLRSREPSLPHPGAVLDAAEKLGRLDAVGRTVRDRAAMPVAGDSASGVLFVNLHVRDLLDSTLISPDAALSGIAKRVVLEITERAALDEVGDVRSRIATLREMGFRIAVDDLGAGYAGLTSFAQLEPEIVKLDMTLVRGIDKNATKQRVVRSMASLSRDMGMLVVAEGVETPEERDVLVELGCDLLQGFLFAKPAPPFPSVSW